MANLSINTTQNVNLNYKVVGVGERMIAFFVDAIVYYAYALLLQGVSSILNVDLWDRWSQIGLESTLMLPVFFYSFLMHILFNGRTLGKMAMKTRVVMADGSPVHWSNYGIKWLLRLVDVWLFIGSFGILSVLFSNKKQTLGDAAAGTILISTKNDVKISHTMLEEISEEYQPVFPSVTLLNDRDVRIIKETFRIAKRSKDYKTLTALRTKVTGVIGVESELFDLPFLDTILKDYQFYTQDS